MARLLLIKFMISTKFEIHPSVVLQQVACWVITTGSDMLLGGTPAGELLFVL